MLSSWPRLRFAADKYD